MKDEPGNGALPTAGGSSAPALPAVVDRATWPDSPPGWPQPFGTRGEQFRTNGRPTAQWSRLAAGHPDDLGTASTVPEGNRDSCTT
jgi:hypothetical protein